MAKEYDGIDSIDVRFETPQFVKTIHKKVYPGIDPTSPALSAAGKTVLITGGCTGIGYSIARSFAAAGASTLILLARRASNLEKASAALAKDFPTTQILTYPTDINISNAQSVSTTLEKAAQAASSHSIDILVLSAVYTFRGSSVLEHSAADVKGCFDVNVLGNLHLVKTFLGLASTTGHTRTIIDISSNTVYGPYPLSGVYGASKGAFGTMLKHIQRENPHIRTYSFHPGAIATEAMRTYGIEPEQMGDLLDDESLPGGFAVWLASPTAEFLKGRHLQAKWDVQDLVANKELFEKDPFLATVYLKLD